MSAARKGLGSSMRAPASALPHARADAGRGGSARLFVSAGSRYWLGVFPAARSTQRRLRGRAAAIPDPRLRADALASHRDKRSNSEGLAALALLAPDENRDRIVRSLVAYQLMLDYLDGVSERPSADPIANGLRLHSAFEVALDPEAEHRDYYELAHARDDGGYLVELIETVRGSLAELPSYPAARDPLLRQARLCGESQALNHALAFAPVQGRVEEWAAATAAGAGLDSGFEWWEVIAAAAASSLCVGALLALAARPGVERRRSRRGRGRLLPLGERPERPARLPGRPRRRPRRRQPPASLRVVVNTRSGVSARSPSVPASGSRSCPTAGSMRRSSPRWERCTCLSRRPGSPRAEAVSRAVYEAFGPLTRPALLVHVARRGGRGAGALLRARRDSKKQDLPGAAD